MVKQRSFAIFSVVFAAVFVVLLVMLLVTGYSIEKFTGQAETFFAAYSHIDGMNEMKGHFASLTKDAALEFFILTGAALLTTLVLVSGASYVIVYNMLLLPVLRIHTGIQEIIKGNFPKVFSAPASAGADLLVERFNEMSEYLYNERLDYKRKMAELMASEEKFSTAFEYCADVLTINRIHDKRYIEASAAFFHVLGYTREEVIGHTAAEIGLWHNPEERVQIYNTLWAKGSFRDVETVWCTKKGERKVGLGSAEVITIGGEPCILFVWHDITERKQAEQALLASEEKYSKAFRYASDIMGIVKLRTQEFIEVSEAFFRILGYSKREIIGYTSLEIQLWENVKARDAIYERLGAGETFHDVEVVWRDKSGNPKIGSMSGEVIDIGGEPCVLFVWHDIGDRKKAEEALKAAHDELEAKVEIRTQELTAANQELLSTNEELQNTLTLVQQMQKQLVESEKIAALGSLVIGVAHEMNTPIGVGITAASHLQEATKDFLQRYEQNMLKRRDMAEYLEDVRLSTGIISNSMEQAAGLVRSFKQINGKSLEEDRRIFSVREHLDEILLSLRPKLKLTAHIIQVHCDKELSIYGTPTGFTQIIINLVMNSLTHAYEKDQSGLITISAQATDLHHITLTYADDGKGMEEGVLARIYEPFFTTRRGTGGSGLGLYILYNVVTQQFGGTVECYSQPGKGTQFIITLPEKAL